MVIKENVMTVTFLKIQSKYRLWFR